MTNYRARAGVMLFLLMAATAGLIYRAAVLTVGDANKIQTNLAIINRKPVSVEKLILQVAKLDGITNDIERTTLSDVKAALTETATLLKETQLEIDAQYQAWDAMKSAMEKDDATYRSVAMRLAAVRSQQDDQILRLRELIDSAQQPPVVLRLPTMF